MNKLKFETNSFGIKRCIINTSGRWVDYSVYESFENLRYASPALNTKNRAKTKNLKSSRFKGVHFVTKSRKWRAMCQDGTDIRIIGYFNTEDQAEEAYDNYVTCLGLYHTSNKDLGLFD